MANDGYQVLFTRSQGKKLLYEQQRAYPRYYANLRRPVVVAENMIGVAMYELVSTKLH